MTAPRIVVTGKIPEPGVEVLKTIGEVWAWTDDEPIPHDIRDEQLATADAVVTLLTDTVDEAFLDAAPQLKIVANVAVGYNNIDVGLCQVRRRDGYQHAGGAHRRNRRSRHGSASHGDTPSRRRERLIRSETPWKWGMFMMLGTGLQGRQLGIIGMGGIGKRSLNGLARLECRSCTTTEVPWRPISKLPSMLAAVILTNYSQHLMSSH